MFFVATVLLVLVVSLTVHLLRKVLWPWGNIRGLKEASLNPTLSQKVAKFKEERRFSFFTFWFVVKVYASRSLDCPIDCPALLLRPVCE